MIINFVSQEGKQMFHAICHIPVAVQNISIFSLSITDILYFIRSLGPDYNALCGHGITIRVVNFEGLNFCGLRS